VGSPLEGLPLTRFPGRGRSARRHRPRRTIPRRSSRRRVLGRPGRPGRRFPRRGRTRRCPAECPRRRTRPATEARPADARPEAEAGAARDRARSGAPRRPRAKRARAQGPRGTGRGAPTPSALSGRKRSRPPADEAPVSTWTDWCLCHRVARAPRHTGAGEAGRSTGTRFRHAAGPGNPAPECPCRGPPRCGRGTSLDVYPTRVVVATPTRAAGCRQAVPRRPRPDCVRGASPTRRGRRPTQRVPLPSRSP